MLRIFLMFASFKRHSLLQIHPHLPSDLEATGDTGALASSLPVFTISLGYPARL